MIADELRRWMEDAYRRQPKSQTRLPRQTRNELSNVSDALTRILTEFLRDLPAYKKPGFEFICEAIEAELVLGEKNLTYERLQFTCRRVKTDSIITTFMIDAEIGPDGSVTYAATWHRSSKTVLYFRQLKNYAQISNLIGKKIGLLFWERGLTRLR